MLKSPNFLSTTKLPSQQVSRNSGSESNSGYQSGWSKQSPTLYAPLNCLLNKFQGTQGVSQIQVISQVVEPLQYAFPRSVNACQGRTWTPKLAWFSPLSTKSITLRRFIWQNQLFPKGVYIYIYIYIRGGRSHQTTAMRGTPLQRETKKPQAPFEGSKSPFRHISTMSNRKPTWWKSAWNKEQIKRSVLLDH